MIPKKIPLLIVSNIVLLPGSSMRIPVKSIRNVNMVKNRLLDRNTLGSTIIGVVHKEDKAVNPPGFHHIGTAAVVVQVTGTNWPEPSYTLLVTGLCRFKLDELVQESPFFVGRIIQLEKVLGEEQDNSNVSEELEQMANNFREQASELVEILDISIPIVAKLKKMLKSLPSENLPDVCASIVKASYEEKLQVLDAVDLNDRFKHTLPLLMRQIEALKLLRNARRGNFTSLSGPKTSQIKNLFSNSSDELDENEADEMTELEEKIRSVKMSNEAEKYALKEFKRLKKMPAQMPEYSMIRNYLDLITKLPWSKSSKTLLNIRKVQQDLDTDHYGLNKVKKRVIEYLAVRQLNNNLKGPIICLVGAPGVGKTSIGRSIARSLQREFHRISLGGICDQSDIRGHRRTYIGSMPGRIIQGLKTVQTNNPVFLLDEIDKLNTSLHGDPAAALLEVLDPEQNNSFVDHYLNVPFDLSEILFLATANSVQTIPAALLDRMEVIEIPGYTWEEKLRIAVDHLLPKQLRENGLLEKHLRIPEESIQFMISRYTREAGVRMMERRLGAICRAVAVKLAQSVSSKNHGDQEDSKSLNSKSDAYNFPELPFIVDETAIKDILGPIIHESTMAEQLSKPGVAVGLAWTAAGGEIMFVESSRMKGDGKLVLTGQLGNVMKESASLALNWIRSNASHLGITEIVNDLKDYDIHIHFPAGAINKDGPSAGVTMVTALISLLTSHSVCSDVAMTGEITLRGIVLPVGGIKEKILAAHQAGISKVILPKKNEKDLVDVPENIKKDLKFTLVTYMEEVLNIAFNEDFHLIKRIMNLDSKL